LQAFFASTKNVNHRFKRAFDAFEFSRNKNILSRLFLSRLKKKNFALSALKNSVGIRDFRGSKKLRAFSGTLFCFVSAGTPD